MAVGGSSRFLWHVLRLPVEFFSQRFAGDISSRVGINDRVAQLLSRDLATNALGALMVVFFAVILFQYDAVLTLVGIAVVSLNVAALRYVSRKRVDGNRRLLQDQGKLLGTAIGGLQTIETLKATGGESDLFARWAGYQAKVVNGAAGPGALHPDPRRRAAAARRGQHRPDPGDRRPAGDERRAHPGRRSWPSSS